MSALLTVEELTKPCVHHFQTQKAKSRLSELSTKAMI